MRISEPHLVLSRRPHHQNNECRIICRVLILILTQFPKLDVALPYLQGIPYPHVEISMLARDGFVLARPVFNPPDQMVFFSISCSSNHADAEIEFVQSQAAHSPKASITSESDNQMLLCLHPSSHDDVCVSSTTLGRTCKHDPFLQHLKSTQVRSHETPSSSSLPSLPDAQAERPIHAFSLVTIQLHPCLSKSPQTAVSHKTRRAPTLLSRGADIFGDVSIQQYTLNHSPTPVLLGCVCSTYMLLTQCMWRFAYLAATVVVGWCRNASFAGTCFRAAVFLWLLLSRDARTWEC